MNAKTRTKKELIKAIDEVVERILNTDACDKETAELFAFIVKELDPELHAAIREANNRRFEK